MPLSDTENRKSLFVIDEIERGQSPLCSALQTAFGGPAYIKWYNRKYNAFPSDRSVKRTRSDAEGDVKEKPMSPDPRRGINQARSVRADNVTKGNTPLKERHSAPLPLHRP
ncbi:hypothetical protein NDU88_008673 [Pleurodeles waltl]|uniref:Uncharacterized protein n=1 Tax=Pleurodeles waltl TaxID=8319 RepID=A0AAV7P493_PLEWA|nr:hypothetical protein NDU88_008673 [Pleurodeles waltl]